jgi:hypothetical protein
MASLTLNDIPDAVMAELERRAVADNSSVEAEVRKYSRRSCLNITQRSECSPPFKAFPGGDPDFVVERSKETGRKVDLCNDD